MSGIVIVGGGVVGASCALMLGIQGNKVTLIESQNQDTLMSPKLDRRTIALSYGSVLLFKELNIWEQLSQYSTAIKNIIVSQQTSFAKTFLKASKYDIPAFGYTISLQLIKKILFENLSKYENITVKFQQEVIELKQDKNQINQIVIKNLVNNKQETINYKLCIAADGNSSFIKQSSNINNQQYDYNQTAIVGTLFHTKSHNNYAFERFGKNNTIAVLPVFNLLNKNKIDSYTSSLVWVFENAGIDKIINLNKSDFIKQLQINFGYRLGKIINIENKQCFPLAGIMSDKLYNLDKKSIFLGNAANSLHPVMAQGLNLGLRDAYSLSKIINKYYKIYNDLDNLEFLEDYSVSRAEDHKNIIKTTHFLANNKIPLFPKNLGLFLFNDLPFVQSSIVSSALGLNAYA
tara:strand:- start:15497 stop:16708 length:1212 start_codon:yes stop_codon:yes gene_type:complete